MDNNSLQTQQQILQMLALLQQPKQQQQSYQPIPQIPQPVPQLPNTTAPIFPQCSTSSAFDVNVIPLQNKLIQMQQLQQEQDKAQIELLTRENKELKERLERVGYLEEKCRSLKEKARKNEQQISENFEQQNRRLARQIEEMEANAKDQETKVRDLDRRYDQEKKSLFAEIEGLKEQLANRESDEDEICSLQGQLKEVHMKLHTEVESRNHLIEQIDEKKTRYKEKFLKVRDDLTKRKNEFYAALENISHLEFEVKRLHNENKSLKAANESLKLRKDVLNLKADDTEKIENKVPTGPTQ